MAERVTLTWPAGPQTSGEVHDHRQEESLSLIARCLEGHEPAFATLYDLHASMIFRLCYGLLQQKEDAEEVLQDCFEYAFRKLSRYDPTKASFKTWLYQIAISRCRNKRRRRTLPAIGLGRLLGWDQPDPDVPAPEEVAVLRDRQRLVWQAVGRLSPKLREVAVLRYHEGLAYAEISQVLGIPAKTVESRMRLAHRSLRDALARES